MRFIRRGGKIIPIKDGSGSAGRSPANKGKAIGGAITSAGVATSAVGYSRMTRNVAEGFKQTSRLAHFKTFLKKVPNSSSAQAGATKAIMAGQSAVNLARKYRKVGRAGLGIAAVGAGVSFLSTRKRK